LLALLGLADDPRNRASVNRYLDLAAPPVNAPAEPARDDIADPPGDNDNSHQA
jgi:hypothetical protein